MFHITVAMFLGIIAGCFTGMIPGLHINLLSALLVSGASSIGTGVHAYHIATFIISMSVTHTFIDAIPSIYLGAPDPSQFLTALPGHRMFIEGKAHKAVSLTVIGSLLGLLFSLSFLGLFVLSLPHLYNAIGGHIGHILIFLVIFICIDLSSMAKTAKRFLFFMVAGCYGAIIMSISSLTNPMFHMLSGLFGLSILIDSLRSGSEVSVQRLDDAVPGREAILPSFIASIAGLFAAFMPGFSTSQNAVALSRLFKKMDPERFLVLLGSLDTSGMVASLASFYALERARNGSIIAVKDMLGAIGQDVFLILVLVMLVSGPLATILALRLSRTMSHLVARIDYRRLVLSVVASIVLISFLFDGLLGIFILLCCTATGLYASYHGVSKNYLMGCIMLPVIIFFIF